MIPHKKPNNFQLFENKLILQYKNKTPIDRVRTSKEITDLVKFN